MTSARRDEAAAEADFGRWQQRGDAAALGRVFDRLAPELLLVAAHLADRSSAEDLVQATFVAAITDAARWQADRPLMPWLVGILANLARRERDRAARRLDGARVQLHPADDPRAIAEREEAARMLAAALQGMPRHYRQVLTLRLVHGLEPLAIAHALGTPPATIKSRLQRGMAMLQRALPAGLRALGVLPIPLSFPSLASLEAVRTAVLSHAKSHLVAGSGLAAGTVLASGGILLMKKITLVVATVVLGTAVALTLPSLAGAPNSSAPAAPPTHAAATAARSALPIASDATPGPAQSVDTAREAVAAAAPAVAAPTVHGRVVSETGQPLADVEVYLGDESHAMFRDASLFVIHAAHGRTAEQAREHEAQAARSAADGSFTLAPPPHQRPHLLVAWSPQRGCRAIDLPADIATPIEIVLPIDPVASGVVRSAADHRPIAGARVNCWPATSGYPIEYRTTDADGTFRFVPLPVGDYRLAIEGDGFAPREATFQLTAGANPSPQVLELTPLPAVDLVFVDDAGQAWTPERIGHEVGAAHPELVALVSKRPYARLQEMMAESWDSYHLRFYDDGHLRGFRSLDAAHVFSLWCGGEKLFEVPDFDPSGDRLVAAMLARTTIPLQVAVAFQTDVSPTPTVHLAITDPSGFGQRMQPLVERTTAAATCVLPVPAQFAGSECGLLAECDGCAPFFTVLPIPAHATGTWQEIVLSPATGAVRGVVVDSAGKPIPQAKLQLADQTGRWFVPPKLARRNGGLDGSFEFTGLPTRTAWLLVSAPDFAARAFAVDTQTTEPLRLELRAGREVAVTVPAGVTAICAVVRDRDGRPLQDDRLSGTKRYGELTVPTDLDAATIAVFDGVTGSLVGEGPLPADGKKLVITDQRR